MMCIGMTFFYYIFVFITIIDRVNMLFFFKQYYVLRVPLPTRDVNNIILRPILFF